MRDQEQPPEPAADLPRPSPYEAPEHPELRLDTVGLDVAGAAQAVIDMLGDAGILSKGQKKKA